MRGPARSWPWSTIAAEQEAAEGVGEVAVDVGGGGGQVCNFEITDIVADEVVAETVRDAVLHRYAMRSGLRHCARHVCPADAQRRQEPRQHHILELRF